jgi:cytochrome c oxidase cbb3-type subunit 4
MIGIVRGLITLALMSSFIGMMVWAWSSARKETFDAIARLPLEDDGTADHGSERA